MTFDLYPTEQAARVDAMPGMKTPETGAFTGFLRGTGMGFMRGMAQVPRAASMLLSTAAIAEDAYYGGTAAQDKHFKFHDDVFNRAVDFWTPKPNEVGVAGEVAGQLLAILPQVIVSPAAAVATTQMSVGEDLVRKGATASKAVGVGAIQGATLATGIWMPILGKTGFQRMVIGGAGFNLAQGIGSRAASGAILEGTPAAKDFQAFDGTALTLDVLLGLAFGGLAHLSPRQRAQGEDAWRRIEAWAKDMKPSDVDALAVLRQAQHLNTDSSPVVPAGMADIDAHTQRMRTAIDQLARDLPVRVDDLPAARGEVDPKRVKDAERRLADLQRDASRVAKDEGIDLSPAKLPAESALAENMRQPGDENTDFAHGKQIDDGVAKAVDLRAAEAQRFASENPDFRMIVGKDAAGNDIAVTPKQYLDNARAEAQASTENVRLFDIAAACMLGAR